MCRHECTIHCKGRRSAKKFIWNRQIKVGICFFVLVCWKIWYKNNIMDKGYGNETDIPPAVSSETTFSQLRGVMTDEMDEVLMLKDNPSTLWSLQMAHLRQGATTPEGRMVVINNFHTCHAPATQVGNVIHQEVCSIGTVRLNYLDNLNKKYGHKAMGQLKDSVRGDCCLVHVPSQCKPRRVESDRSPTMVLSCVWLLRKTGKWSRSIWSIWTKLHSDLFYSPVLRHER